MFHIQSLMALGMTHVLKHEIDEMACVYVLYAKLLRTLKKVTEFILGGWNSIVSIVTWLQTERSGV